MQYRLCVCLLIFAVSTWAIALPGATTSPLILTDNGYAGNLHTHLDALGRIPIEQWPAGLKIKEKPAVTTTKLKDAEWYHVKLENHSSAIKNWFFATPMVQAQLLRVYRQSDVGVEQVLEHNSATPFMQRPLWRRTLAAPVKIQKNEKISLYIQYQGLARFPLQALFYDEQSFESRNTHYELLNGIAFGIVFFLLLFFSFQFFIKPSKTLGFYSLLVLSVGIYIAQLTGYGFQYLWPGHPEFNLRFNTMTGGITYFWYFLFTASFFDLKNVNVKHYRIVQTISILILAMVVIGLFIDVTIFMALLALVVLPAPLFIAYFAFKRGHRSAILFIIGATIHLSTTYLFVLACMGITVNVIQPYIFAISGAGQLLDILLFSGAILYQSKIVQAKLNYQLICRVKDAEAIAKLEQDKAASAEKIQSTALQLAATTHDLTQPLASLKMLLSMIDDESHGEIKIKMKQAIEYTEGLLCSILATTKKEYFEKQAFISIPNLMEPFLQRYEKPSNKTLRLYYAVSEFKGLNVVLHRILSNLISNAFRYGGNEILVSFRLRKNNMLIQVWDQGVGLTVENITSIQEPFTQLSPINENKNGHGLGLYIVKSLCDKAEYTLTIQSNKNKGSCFSILITQ